jgi:hypothetical protein
MMGICIVHGDIHQIARAAESAPSIGLAERLAAATTRSATRSRCHQRSYLS